MLRVGRSLQRRQLLQRQARAAFSTKDETPAARTAPSNVRGLDALKGISLHASAHTQRVSIDDVYVYVY